MFAAVVVAAWILLALAVALGVGGAIRLADRRAPFTDQLIGLPADLTVEHILGARSTAPTV